MKIGQDNRGFTIVELLIVIVIIGILATIVIVAYNGITTKARQITLHSDLANSRTKLEIANAIDGQYPLVSTVNANKSDYLAESEGNTLTYNTNPSQSTYCISAVGPDNVVHALSNLLGPVKGSCTGDHSEVAEAGDGTLPPQVNYIQTITTANCPSTQTRAVDARDNHTYWVKKIGSLCWMMTNLAYAGGGTNTYGDVKTITNSETLDYANAYYMIPAGSNVTTEPTDPSTSTNGISQYGYLYNWCAAMGGQVTAACDSTVTPTPVTTTTVCPYGWRLPVGNNNEFATLNTIVNSGSISSDAGLIGSGWLGQWSGYWNGDFDSQDTSSFYWSSSLDSEAYAFGLNFDSTSVNPAFNGDKSYGFAVRCVAAA